MSKLNLAERCFSGIYLCMIPIFEVGALVFSIAPGMSRLRHALAGRWKSIVQRRRHDGTTYWFHAASRGEVATAAIVAQELLTLSPGSSAVLTAISADGFKSGADLSDIFSETSFLLPELRWLQVRFIRRVNPKALIIVDGDFWRNSIRAAHRCRVPVVVVNGRISEKSTCAYSKIPGFRKGTFDEMHSVYAQTAADAVRFAEVTMDAVEIKISGNVKIGAASRRAGGELVEKMRNFVAQDPRTKLFCFASIHPEELETLSRIADNVLECVEHSRVIFVPRHPEKFLASDDVALLGDVETVRLIPDQPTEKRKILVAAMGLLPEIYSISRVTFVGGTFCSVGGHNLSEPMHYGSSVLYGPQIHAQDALHSEVQKCSAAIQVKSIEEATNELIQILSCDETHEKMLRRSEEMVSKGRGLVRQIALDLSNL